MRGNSSQHYLAHAKNEKSFVEIDQSAWRVETKKTNIRKLIKFHPEEVNFVVKDRSIDIVLKPSPSNDADSNTADSGTLVCGTQLCIEDSCQKSNVSKVDNPRGFWIFPKQDEAFNFIDEKKTKLSGLNEKGSNILALAQEIATNGARQYVVWRWEDFLPYYFGRFHQCKALHWYEIIRENHPCRLYFDIEFERKYNPKKDGIALANKLISEVSQHLHEIYGFDESSIEVIVLDSSTDIKFSQHLIFHFSNGALFKSNQDIKYFINNFIEKNSIQYDQLKEVSNCQHSIQRLHISELPLMKPIGCDFNVCNMHEKDEELKENWLLVNCSDGNKTCFIDTSVYSKNRCFRLPYSSKYGKTTILRPIYVSANEHEVQLSLESENEVLLRSMIVPVRSYSSGNMRTYFPLLEFEGNRTLNLHLRFLKCKSVFGYQVSPFPQVDKFILDYTSMKKKDISIRKWEYHSGALFYQIDGYRWCENIGRHHQSNNIILIVNLKTKLMYQKCFDPDCQRIDFVSHPVKVDVDLSWSDVEEYELELLAK